MVIDADGFLLMRHGETEANARDVICGSTDIDLTPRGLAQAEAAAEALREAGIAMIYTSSLARARLTAQAVARVTGAERVVVPGLSERNWGGWEGRPRAVLRRDETPPGGESPAVFRARIAGVLSTLDLSRRTLIVAHSGTAREIQALLVDAPHARMANGEVRLWERRDDAWHCHEFFRPLA